MFPFSGEHQRGVNVYGTTGQGDVEYAILERRVMVDDVRHNVNMGKRTCTCRQWQLDGVPCIHAITAITH
ncbi:hypothetical protein MRB53_034513 [Persea americana]|uniref:Uncharacterized protein n=1 Tax=Persea americana TaxID=3435 RepID=A0ACC2K236_PERAE|nr:hypothetical protein MRB53_034513 [Persea americana]